MNKRARIYLDTSVISYLDQQDAITKMNETQELWNLLVLGKYEIVISSITLREIRQCDEEKRDILLSYLSQIHFIYYEATKETVELSQQIIDEGILRPKSKDDALHIAAAILTESDIILSWNFKHLVNINTINGVRKICFANHINKIIDIYSPNILLKGDEENE